MRLPRILHVAESAQGGVGTYLTEVLPYQAARFGEAAVRALVPDLHVSHLLGIDRAQVRTWRRRGRGVEAGARLAAAVLAQVREFRPDIVHAHSSFAGTAVRALFGWRPRPFRIVYCPHGWGFDRRSWSDGAARAVERALVPACDRIVAVSDHERRLGLEAGVPAAKLALVRNGVADRPASQPAPWKDDRLRVLFVGRLDRQKGYDTLMDAVEPWLDRLCVRVVGRPVAGRGPGRPAPAGVEHRGWLSLRDTAAEIAAADVVAVPSRWEGFGLVALEAMREARAVVASGVGGLAEIVADGETGRLVPPDSPEHLARALAEGGRETWRAMGEAGRRRFLQHFTADRMNRELAALYEEALAVPAGAPERLEYA